MAESMTPDEKLAHELKRFYDDPLGHVMFSYPWGKPGSALAHWDGPDQWQREFLTDVGEEVRKRGFDGFNAVDPIRFSTASGHGIGKSAVVAWLIRWILDTRPHSKGVVTANTDKQLKTKTWGELAKWHGMAVTQHWYKLNGGGSLNYYRRGHDETWRVDGQTCEERNSEAFAGLHAAGSTAFYIFDEASAIPDKIFEVREGGATDGEPMSFDFGNPTRNSGRFYENMIGRFRHDYIRRSIDSRDVAITNKRLFKKWAESYGEDSDFFKVRVKGEFPDMSDMQFISRSMVNDCIGRDVYVAPHEPLIMGVDVARFGSHRSVIHCRHGRDHERIPMQIFSGIDTIDLASKILDTANEHRPDAIFIDGGGVGGGVVDQCRRLGLDIVEINFGAKATDKKYTNLRSQMWGNLRDALRDGIRLPDMPDLVTDLTSLEYGYNLQNQIQLEKKEDAQKRGLDSPDLGDAVALTYVWPVHPSRAGYDGQQQVVSQHEYNPFD